MIRKIFAAALICCITATALSAQRTANRSAGSSSADREERASERDGVMDGRRFYNTPYRSRNSGTYGLDRHVLSFGLGFPNTLRSEYNYHSGSHTGFGPIMAKYELAIRDEVGLGAVVDAAYSRYRYNIAGRSYRDKAFGIGVSLLGYYHFNKLIPVRKLDVYAGAGINISHVATTSDYSSNLADNYIDVLPALVAGARYYFRPSFAPYFELGRTNYSYANIGISLNL